MSIIFGIFGIIWLMLGIVSLIHVILDHFKINGNFQDFHLSLIEYINMILILICGPMVGIWIILTKKDNYSH
jgi:hypothetical protein